MQREGKLTQLHEDFKKLEKEEKDDVNHLPQYMIIPEKGESQLLQINLTPASIIFFRGAKIYSNAAQLNITRQNHGSFWTRLFKRDNLLNMIVNDSPSLQILGIRHQVNSGQILILDLSVYKQSFFYNFQHLIASKSGLSKQQKQHILLPQLRLLEHRSKIQSIFDALDVNQQSVVLQADSAIMQKYLGQDEEFYLFNRRNIVAVSENIKLQLFRQGNGLGIKAKGKGWLFYQTSKAKVLMPPKWSNFFLYLLILSFLTPLLEFLIAA